MSAGPDRLALERTRNALRTALAEIEAALAPPATDSLVPVKAAAAAWNISENAALKRAKRGHGEKLLDGRWYFRRSFVDAGRCQDQAR